MFRLQVCDGRTDSMFWFRVCGGSPENMFRLQVCDGMRAGDEARQDEEKIYPGSMYRHIFYNVFLSGRIGGGYHYF